MLNICHTIGNLFSLGQIISIGKGLRAYRKLAGKLGMKLAITSHFPLFQVIFLPILQRSRVQERLGSGGDI